MSSAMVVTMTQTGGPVQAPDASAAPCASCGLSMPSIDQSQADLLEAHNRIIELESQVRILNQKATSAMDRWQDYEDQLARLRAQQQQQQLLQEKPLPEQPQQSPTRASLLQAGTSRISEMLTTRKSTPNLRAVATDSSRFAPPPLPRTASAPVESEEELRRALTREQGLRREAEGRLSATSREVEELSVSLFEQANEMVASERRARAQLEERVGELERRDKEKRTRLERLEKAMGRIERARALLNS